MVVVVVVVVVVSTARQRSVPHRRLEICPDVQFFVVCCRAVLNNAGAFEIFRTPQQRGHYFHFGLCFNHWGVVSSERAVSEQ